MMNQEQYRRKTRSQLVDDQRQGSRPQIPSQNNLQVIQHYSDIDSSKIKEPKTHPARKSNWNRKQKTKYLVFLNYYSELPHWSSDLKSIPTYKALSQFVKSRSPEQCKSYHLSTRRNFKSIEQEIKAIQQQLQNEQGYQKLLDRYEFQIIAFEEEHKILTLNELEQKKYFHNKLLQKCKQTGLNKDININLSGESPQQQQLDYNPKFNIKDLIKEKQIEQNKVIKQQKNPIRDNFQPLINLHYDNLQKKENYLNSINPNLNQQNPNIMMTNPQQIGVNYFGQDNTYNLMDNNKSIDKGNLENMRQSNMANLGSRSQNFTDRRIINPNEKIIQQNINRIIQANKNANAFGQFPTYNNYTSTPFNGMNPMHMTQFRNQMPFQMAPPGGIPYILQGFQNPYGMQSRFPQPTQNMTQKKKISGKQGQNIQFTIGDINRTNSGQSTEQKSNQIFTQKRKQLLLNCHQHWVNWLRAVTQLNRRKQSRNMVINNQ